MPEHDSRFDTPITFTGPWRAPAQMLQDQRVGGHASVHDSDAAAALGLGGAPIEGPTHFSQFDPLAVAAFGAGWFERGCISSHFQTMVVEGEEVQASLTVDGAAGAASIGAAKRDGTPVLTGTVSVGPVHPPTALEHRRARLGEPGDLYIIDQLEVGTKVEQERAVSVDFDTVNGDGYPFSLAEKLARITEPHPWYTESGAATSPWGRPVLPIEMISVLAQKSGGSLPVRQPAMGLFLDLEIRLVDGPVFVGAEYRISREVVGLGQSRRTESYWTRTSLTDADTGRLVAEVLLHSGVFKESYPGYPRHLLTPAPPAPPTG